MAGHDHADATAGKRRLATALGITSCYMVLEAVGGFWSHSLALLADSGHMLADVAALGLSLLAAWLAQKPASPQRSYGNYRTEILAALANGATLLAISAFIVVEAVQRLAAPAPVAGGLMLAIATGGLVANLLSLWVLHAGRNASLNVRGAWLHVLTDAMGSVGAMVAGVLVWAMGWNWIDPLVSILIALLVIHSAWSLIQEVTAVLMEWAPTGMDVDEVRATMLAVPGVAEVTDLHVWTIASGHVALSAHVLCENTAGITAIRKALRQTLLDRFAIHHATLEVDTCEMATLHV